MLKHYSGYMRGMMSRVLVEGWGWARSKDKATTTETGRAQRQVGEHLY